MDALKEPFDHDAIVSLRKVVVRGDELQPAWAVVVGFEIDLSSDQPDIDRREIAADEPRGQRALMRAGQPVLAPRSH
jgi:hypothetical protein